MLAHGIRLNRSPHFETWTSRPDFARRSRIRLWLPSASTNGSGRTRTRRAVLGAPSERRRFPIDVAHRGLEASVRVQVESEPPGIGRWYPVDEGRPVTSCVRAQRRGLDGDRELGIAANNRLLTPSGAVEVLDDSADQSRVSGDSHDTSVQEANPVGVVVSR